MNKNIFALNETTGSKNYFFDACVWRIIFSPTELPYQYDNQIEAYSNLYEKILANDGCIYITHTVISEYTNSLLRNYFDYWKEKQNNPSLNYKKDFRPSEDYRKFSNSVSTQVRMILEDDAILFVENEYIYKKEVAQQSVSNLENSDFNDQLYVQICKKLNYTLITHDRDFSDVKDIEICTNLKHLLNTQSAA